MINSLEEHTGSGAGGGGADLVIQASGLTKRYGSHAVVDGVSFSVARGELFGILGTNGAGKSTTVEILQGLRRADSGDISVLSFDPRRHGDKVRRLIGSQLQDAALPGRMRVGEALSFFASLQPTPRPIDELAREWRLSALQRRPFDALSGGERQRLFVALALIGRPQLVFLDELTQNLDPVGRRDTWEVVRRVRDAGTSVVLVTHDVEEAERLCDRIIVMHEGRIVDEGSPAAVAAGSTGGTTVTFTDADLDTRPLTAVPGVARVARHGPQVEVTGHGPLLAHVGAYLVGLGRPPLDLAVHQPSLESRFVELTTGAVR